MYSRKEPDLAAQGIGSGRGKGRRKSAGKLLFVMAWLVVSLVVQQWYARTHNYSVEQPIGISGIAEYYFRHPEKLISHFES